jgi:hypothetical protein
VPFISRLIFLFAAFLAFAAVPAAAEQRAEPEPVRQAWEMITGLASDSYAMRLQAKTSLLGLGRASIEPLEFAVQSDDPEVRARALEILISLRGRGFLGIGLQEDLAEDDLENGNDKPRGSTVSANQVVNFKQYADYGVTKPFPAEAAGIQAGDKIRAVNDRAVHGTKDLMREVIMIGPARPAIITVERGEKLMRLPVLLTRNPSLRTTQFGQPVRDVAPPVDLEKELDGSSGQKQTSTNAAPEPVAQAQPKPMLNVRVLNVNGAQQVIRLAPPQPAQK